MTSIPAVIAGGDLRQCYLAEFLSQNGFSISCLQTPAFFYKSDIKTAVSVKSLLENCCFFIGPVPFTRDNLHLTGTNISLTTVLDNLSLSKPTLCSLSSNNQVKKIVIGGNIPTHFTQSANSRGITVFDYMDFDRLTEKNAYLTAEGILEIVLRETPFAIKSANVLLIGAGRCAKAIAKMFSPLCESVTIWNRSKGTRPEITGCQCHFGDTFSTLIPGKQIIINTVPARIFSDAEFELFDTNSYLFDIASAPGCIDSTMAASLPFNCFLCPGLPGKTAPKSAAEALGHCCLNILHTLS